LGVGCCSAAYAEAMRITKIIKYFIFYPISLEVTSRYNLAGGIEETILPLGLKNLLKILGIPL